jgi:hypothetical protein
MDHEALTDCLSWVLTVLLILAGIGVIAFPFVVCSRMKQRNELLKQIAQNTRPRQDTSK